MKKQFTILLILIFTLGLFTIKFSNYYSYAEKITDENLIPKVISVSPTIVRAGESFEVFGENFNSSNYFNGGYIVNEVTIALTPVPNYYNPDCSRPVGKIISFSNTKIVVKLECSTPGEGAVCVDYYDDIDSTENKGSISDCYGPRFTIKPPCKINELGIGDDWSCTKWSSCSEVGTHTRTCVKSGDCESLNTPMPDAVGSCTYTPSCTSSNWSCTDWSSCSANGTQSRTCNKISNCQGGISAPATSQSCTYVPTCTYFYYSSWSQCEPNGTQTRNITSKHPANCEGGESPKTTQSCTYTPSCTADTWACGAWSSCSLSGIQNRSCTKTFDCPDVQTAAPITDQYCEAPSRPQQSPPSESDEISNQDIIIKSTVKLLCPVDNYKASQGSGTVIDSAGTILTNKHVIAGTLGCLVGFIDGFNDEPYFGDRQIADIIRISPTQDVAVLKIRNPKNMRLSYVDTTKGSVNFSLGTKITTYGYPAKFGTKITYTSGDFSGTDGSYLKTTAILEYGNSGGGAYLKNGTFIGIPSAVVKGQLNAMGYLLSIDIIKAWLNNSSITSGNTNNNNYSRVSVLEDIDLNKLDSLKLFIPDVDDKGNLSVSSINKNLQNTKKQPQPNQPQKESIIVESPDTNQKINPEQSSSASSGHGKESKEEKDKVSEQRRSIVANAVQEIIKVAERSGGIGQEIKIIAQTQTQNQEKLEIGMQKIQSRSAFAKFFIGPNYSEIKKSQKLLEQNREQIQKLNEARTQIVNQGDQLQVIEQIQALEQVNQRTETLLSESQKGFSLFGWVFRLFSH